jgi:hypothetical protein
LQDFLQLSIHVSIQLPVHVLNQFPPQPSKHDPWQTKVQPPVQLFLHLPVQLFSQSIIAFACVCRTGILANAIAPKMGNVFLVTNLKKTRLDWIFFGSFSINYKLFFFLVLQLEQSQTIFSATP